jgi:hypothetical protein
MNTHDLLMGVLAVLAGFVILVLPCLLAPPIARWLTGRATTWFGIDLYKCSWREFGSAKADGAHAALAGLVIEPGGVGPVQFGVSPQQVAQALSRSLGCDAWDDGNLNDSLIYDGVRLRFDRCDSRGPLPRSRLCEAEVRRADAVLFGRPLADWGEGELVAELRRRGFRPGVLEPGYAEFTLPYLRAWFEAGRLARVAV